MQPRRPHVQRAPSISTTMCPISPAPPRPVQGLPSRIMPPPTPVPQNTPSSDSYGRPAPSLTSASVATCTSLPTRTSDPSAALSFRRAQTCLPVGQVARTGDAPVAIVPGEPTPIPPSCAARSRRPGRVAQRGRHLRPPRPGVRRSWAWHGARTRARCDRRRRPPSGSSSRRGRSRRRRSSAPSSRIKIDTPQHLGEFRRRLQGFFVPSYAPASPSNRAR